MDGSAVLNADGQSVLFVPQTGYVGDALVKVIADDGTNASQEATIPITISGAPLVALDFQSRLPRLVEGQVQTVVVVGDFADQPGVELDASFIAWSASEPSVFTVSEQGQIVGRSDGSGVLTVSRGGLQAATAISVGQPDDAMGLYVHAIGIEVYPKALALPLVDGERQLLVGLKPGDADLATAASGTVYVVSEPGVVTVSADGLVTAVGEGEAIIVNTELFEYVERA